VLNQSSTALVRGIGEWRYSFAILHLRSRFRWAVSFVPHPLYSRERAPNTHWIGGSVGPRAGLDTVEISLLPLPGIEPQFPARRSTDWAISALLCSSQSVRFLPSFFVIGIVGSGVQLGPLGTAATNRPIVPDPGDYDAGEIGGMIGRGNRSTRRKPAPVPLCSPRTPHSLPGREPGPPRWEASD
jgi:hypothetical protein